MAAEMGNNNRGSLWEDDEVLASISIWSNIRIQQDLDGCTRKRPVYEMTVQLVAQGYQRTYIQIREKIKRLKQRYKKVVDNNNRSGSQRKTCPIFKELDGLLCNRPITNPPSVLDSFSEGVVEDEESLERLENDVDEIDGGFSTSSSNETTLGCSQTRSNEAILGEAATAGDDNLSMGSNEKGDRAQKKPEERRLSKKHGKSKKRTRRETFLSEICEMIQEQQKVSDDRFFKLEAERQQREEETEQKRRKEEQDHQMRMMQFIGNMFMQATASLNQQPQFTHPYQSNQCFYPASRTQVLKKMIQYIQACSEKS